MRWIKLIMQIDFAADHAAPIIIEHVNLLCKKFCYPNLNLWISKTNVDSYSACNISLAGFLGALIQRNTALMKPWIGACTLENHVKTAKSTQYWGSSKNSGIDPSQQPLQNANPLIKPRLITVDLLIRGKNIRSIPSELHISMRLIADYAKKNYAKLDLHSRSEAVCKAILLFNTQQCNAIQAGQLANLSNIPIKHRTYPI